MGDAATRFVFPFLGGLYLPITTRTLLNSVDLKRNQKFMRQQVKLFFCRLWRRTGGEGLNLYSFFTSSEDGGERSYLPLHASDVSLPT